MERAHHWWQRGVIYHIYPRSFQDSNGDGEGDLADITSRLDYLAWLGVDAIWISPIYPSPLADGGYDVADYTDIDPRFGTLADFDRLVAEAHRRGIRVILDYVPNHSSDRHPWFLASRASRDNPKRDWYLWRDPAPDGGPPTNWLSYFGGSAWTWDEQTGQYYLHSYLPEQPDLNWRNPAVRHAMLDVLRFWLDRGVDGFRVDALSQVIKDDRWRDNPPNPHWRPGDDPSRALLRVYTSDLPEVHAVVRDIRQVLDAYPDRVLIGELYLPIERLLPYYGERGEGCHLPTNFHLILSPWRATEIGALMERYEAALPDHGWPNWVLGNHDQPRVATRIGPAQARVAAMLLLTARGTPTMYYGDEIGMQDVPIPPERAQDPVAWRLPGLGLGRDPARTPMQWDRSPGAGFTTGEPWLPLAPDAAQVNVAAQQDDPRSLLTLYRRLLALRREEPALQVGAYLPRGIHADVVAFERRAGGRRFLIALNLGAHPTRVEPDTGAGRIVLSTALDRDGEPVAGMLALRGDEGVIVALDGAA
ncbi:MAG: alpha-amylase family glycosyl hydrolase [Sphaerobacter sp.]|nr:alpha-amylase family glycosyl hydrolase [Sphaerobacter sp.]